MSGPDRQGPDWPVIIGAVVALAVIAWVVLRVLNINQ
jgi:hypothetical protein